MSSEERLKTPDDILRIEVLTKNTTRARCSTEPFTLKSSLNHLVEHVTSLNAKIFHVTVIVVRAV